MTHISRDERSTSANSLAVAFEREGRGGEMSAMLTRLVFFLTMILVGCASQSPAFINPPLREIRSAKEATVALFPMYMESWKALDEERIRKYGCTYTTKNPKLVAQLIEVLQSQVAVVSHPVEPWEQEPRELVYLDLVGGEKVKFRFGAVFANQSDVRGVFVAKRGKAAVTAKLSFPKALYEWAATVDEDGSAGGNHGDKACSFVHHYRDYRS